MGRAPRQRAHASRQLHAIRLGAVFLVAMLALGLAFEGRAPTPPAELEAVELAVEGLHCPLWCPVKIDRALEGMSGVYGLEVDVTRGLVRARIDTERISLDELARRLSERGWLVLPR